MAGVTRKKKKCLFKKTRLLHTPDFKHCSPQLDKFHPKVFFLFFTMSNSSSRDEPYTMEPSTKKTIWQCIRENPKIIFIAFFAS